MIKSINLPMRILLKLPVKMSTNSQSTQFFLLTNSNDAQIYEIILMVKWLYHDFRYYYCRHLTGINVKTLISEIIWQDTKPLIYRTFRRKGIRPYKLESLVNRV